jgi:hypothetical protein
MRQGSQWIGGNAARFAALWFAALTLGALVIPGEGQWFPAPHSLPGLLTLPFALCVMVFLAAAAAFVALVAFTPVLVLWLAVYLAVIFGLTRAAIGVVGETRDLHRGACAVGSFRARGRSSRGRRLARDHLCLRTSRAAVADETSRTVSSSETRASRLTA